ncbi:ABC transporter substrate-binding protein [Psychromonas sp. SP041]|uniref:siderophore ABC transporter substrate-binding protein n=1 Tax=Psychromonas sp. SP041 TaxID=1365007 RepID=UPI0009DBCFBB|nr:ABC transporter substrate-binding protein [Psychromonas sp. SP041]
MNFLFLVKKRILNKLVISLFITLFSSVSATAQTIKHALGTIEIDGIPKRVVVLGHGSLDYLDALGINPVGVTKQLLPDFISKYNDKQYSATGSLHEPNFETIFTLKPDIIIAENRQSTLYKELSEIAPVYMFQIDNSNYWEATQHHWRVLGIIFNKESRAEELIKEVQAGIDDVKKNTSQHPSKALVVMNNGNNLAMFGEQSRFSLIYQEFNFGLASSQKVPVVTGPHGNLISFEYIADAKPEVMFILDREQAIGQSNGKAKALFDNDLVNTTVAAKKKRIVFMDPAAWYLGTGGYQATKIMISDAQTAFK